MKKTITLCDVCKKEIEGGVKFDKRHFWGILYEGKWISDVCVDCLKKVHAVYSYRWNIKGELEPPIKRRTTDDC
jgi:hypothetical protein